MEPIYQTGNETVDRLSRVRLTGNVIPPGMVPDHFERHGKAISDCHCDPV